MKILAKYHNGNYDVTLFNDGTKVRENDLDNLTPDFVESMDCKITNQCPYGCPMCYARSTPDGKHADIMNAKFIDSLHAGTEIAIGGGAVTSHPDLVLFLKKLKNIGVFPGITVNQREYINNYDLIESLIKEELIYGIGVSFSSFDDNFWNKVTKNKNVVVHLIAGMYGGDVFNYFANKNVKILILGYKDFGRGHDLLSKANDIINIQLEWLKSNLKDIIAKYDIISFDNLAIEQLDVKNVLTEQQWNDFYQGEDGTHTMYVDLVEQKFAKTSISTDTYPLLDNVDDMFKIIRGRE